MMDDVEIEFASDPNYDFLVAEVYYMKKYMFMLYVIPKDEGYDIFIKFFRNDELNNPFSGEMKIQLYMDIVEEARRRYAYRLEKGRNPFPDIP